MALVVQAEVVDIRSDAVRPGDAFLVDTNVWWWMTYTKASHVDVKHRPTIDQITHYPAYIGSALHVGARLTMCGLSFAELAHIIENAELDIYNKTNPHVSRKGFRHLPSERGLVVAEIQAAWGQVKSLASLVSVMVDEIATAGAVQRCCTDPLDGYDLFILHAALTAGIVQIITDDKDFTAVPGIKVFTANHSAITEATSQGKMLAR